MENNPVVFELSDVLEYSKNGEFAKTAVIELSAPTMATFDISTEMSQLVMRATVDARNLATGDEVEAVDSKAKIDAESVKLLLFSSSSVKFSEVATVSRKLFCTVGKCDDAVKLNDSLIDKLSPGDFIRMICEYIANFIFPSLFSGGE